MSRGRAGITVVLVSTLISCAQPRPPPASEEERTAVTNAVLVCLDNAALKVDDRTSDASTIAVAIMGICDEKFRMLDEAYFRQENNATRQILMSGTWDTHFKMAIRTVLAVRNGRTKGNAR
jgi:hypothetical protein